jgi:hypothetical protein
VKETHIGTPRSKVRVIIAYTAMPVSPDGRLGASSMPREESQQLGSKNSKKMAAQGGLEVSELLNQEKLPPWAGM